MTARVDVGIPTAGKRKYIHEAIASVRAQSFTDWRLIISVNNIGSSEDLSAYAGDERIDIRPTDAALTAYGNKNAVIRASTAPYLAILDDDDAWDPGFLERRVEVLDNNPECAFVFSTFVEMDADGVEIGRGFEPFGPPGVYKPETLMVELLAHPSERRIYTAMVTALVRRDALHAVGPAFDESLPIIGDYELWLRLASRYPAAYLHSWDAFYRRHPAQDTHRLVSGDSSTSSTVWSRHSSEVWLTCDRQATGSELSGSCRWRSRRPSEESAEPRPRCSRRSPDCLPDFCSTAAFVAIVAGIVPRTGGNSADLDRPLLRPAPSRCSTGVDG